MSRYWTKAAAGVGLVAAIGLLGGFAYGAPPQAGGTDYPAAKNTPRDKDTPRDTAKDAYGATKNTEPDARKAEQGAKDAVRNTDRDARNTPDRDKGQDARDSRDSARDAHSTARVAHREHRSVGELGLTLGRVTERGLTVGRLASTSLLAQAGLRAGDVMISVNGHRLRGNDDFERWLFAGDPNDRATIVVWRDDREVVIYVAPTVLYLDDQAVDQERPFFGIDFDTNYGDRVVIRRVHPNSPAFAAGLRAGDEITTWNGVRVTTPEAFVQIIRGVQPGTVNFEYMRDSKRARAEAKFDRRETRKETRP